MERLTKTLEKQAEKFAYLPGCKDACIYGWSEEEAGCRCDKFTEILCRLAKIEDILGDEYDLDHLRELVEADLDGRCVVLPISTPSMAYTVDPKGGYISSGFYITPGAVLHDIERGYVIVKTREEGEETLKGEQNV